MIAPGSASSSRVLFRCCKETIGKMLSLTSNGPDAPIGSHEWFVEVALARGARAAKVIGVDKIVVSEWVALKCRYGCGGYGKCLTCPPFAPAPETTRRLLGEYSRALILRIDANGQDNELDDRHSLRTIAGDLEREFFLAGCYKAFGLGAGHCTLCVTCDTSRACLFPDKARPAAEACGIDVAATVRNVGWTMEVVSSPMHDYSYFALILID